MGNPAVREIGGVVRPSLLRPRRSPAIGLAVAALMVVAVTLLVYPLQTVDPGVSSGVLYVLGVLLVSVYWGLRLKHSCHAGRRRLPTDMPTRTSPP